MSDHSSRETSHGRDALTPTTAPTMQHPGRHMIKDFRQSQ
jgi:hypothetical protein